MMSGVLIIDKPTDWTSHDCVNYMRRVLKTRKIGHAGTLDPLATGVLVLLVGRATKLASHLICNDKTYLTEFLLGRSTDSFDITGETTNTSELEVGLEDVQKALLAFQGNIEQIAPPFSAKKYKGRKLYELARAGEKVPKIIQKVTISKIKILKYEYPRLELEVSCSSGTYIRSLAEALGLLLKSYACVAKIRRTRSGKFDIKQAVPLKIATSNDLISLDTIKSGVGRV